MIIGLVNLDSVINTYQTSVLSITCGSPTDAISDWTLILCAGVLSRCLASWLLHLCTVTHSVQQPGFDLSQWQWSLLHHFHTAQGHAMSAGRDDDRSTLTCVPVESHKRCLTSSISVRCQSWLVACPSCILQMMTLLRGWPTMDCNF